MALTKDPVDNRRCPDCGRAFHCGIENDTPCWCATEFRALMPLTDAAAGCYCRECLGKQIAARQEAARKPLT
ncbi:MAG: cysteine-rich CWC family protein [Burkholderiales bacterium]